MYSRDWSSDVCSSDLVTIQENALAPNPCQKKKGPNTKNKNSTKFLLSFISKIKKKIEIKLPARITTFAVKGGDGGDCSVIS